MEKKIILKDIEAMMEKKKIIPFDPKVHFTLNVMLAQVAPHFYTNEELSQIEELHQSVCQETKPSLILQNPIKEKVDNNKKMCCSSSEGSSMSCGERRVKPKTIKEKELSQPPKLSIQVMDKIAKLNGTKVRYVMCKKLFKTDLNMNNNRLSMPLNKIKCDFLTEIEKKILDTKEEDKPLGLEVIVLDSSFREFTMSLKMWKMHSKSKMHPTSVYNLIRNWRLLVAQNNLKEDQKLNIWSFRVNDKLHFLLDDKNS
ncbi:B3 domain-containing protein At3g25182-like [Cicer arietinum]|uniref:B3 domain-containing protein At3g25182-like n=1 Tax=Cicer arietinum TaxID=3827 RepID=A0A1S2YL26_CICAR|nr:B3 domain-containing protein At3g25182-like [Cicer arietinum]